MMLVETVELQCPFCGEIISVLVDCSLGDQSYVEDCSVCCHQCCCPFIWTKTGSRALKRSPKICESQR